MTAQLPSSVYRIGNPENDEHHFTDKKDHADIAKKNGYEVSEYILTAHEQEPVAWLLAGGGAKNVVCFDSGNAYADPLRDVTPLYTHPAPVPAVSDAVSKLLNILDRHTVELGWCEPPISLAELVIARDGREELDAIRAMLNGGKS